jgi:hypothetical protein
MHQLLIRKLDTNANPTLERLQKKPVVKIIVQTRRRSAFGAAEKRTRVIIKP